VRTDSAAGCTPATGVGEITAAALWAELGDTRRFSSSRKAVRHTGLDITVYSSDGKRPPDKLSRQGSPLLNLAATAPFTGLALQALDALTRLSGPAAAPAPG
jgi:transposase